MKHFVAVINGNRVNRYNMLFTISALESGLAQSWDIGIPMHVGHDLHRLFAWSRALGIHLEPGQVRLTGVCYVPETDAESDQICRLASSHRAERLREAVEPHLEELKAKLGLHLSDAYRPYNPSCAALRDSGLAVRTFPKLFSQKDKDGLIPVASLKPLAPGAFEHDGMLIFAHPFFRRSLSRLNSLNSPFLSQLFSLQGESGLDVRVALDEDMVGLAHTFQDYFELEYWWGPKFNDDLERISLGIARYEATEMERDFHGISRREFWWYAQDEARTFECEELRDLPAVGTGDESFGCRFVHSRLDPDSGKPVHLDGAVRMYDAKAMVQRLDQDIYRAGRHSKYTKLWRVDGQLSVTKWKELICHFYRNNWQVGEYLGGVDTNCHGAPTIIAREDTNCSISIYVPYEMQKGDGVRMHVAYNKKDDRARPARELVALDWLTRGVETYNFVEADSADLVKLLRRNGHEIETGSDIVRIAFEDMVVNLPLIMHAGSDARTSAEVTLSTVSFLCQTWSERGDDRLISFTIGVEYDDRDVYFSFAGHVADLRQWLLDNPLRFPDDSTQFGTWLEQVDSSFLPEWGPANNRPALQSMMHKSGVLAFKRKFVEPSEGTLRFKTTDDGLLAELWIPTDENKLCELVSSGSLQVRPYFILKESECSRCNHSYESCLCCKITDSGVRQVIKRCDLLGAFWTTRPA
jgi:hypothetical protein